jgi:hypothetical protein
MTDINVLKLNNVTASFVSEVDRVRYPDQIFTDSYLNDPIFFDADDRLQDRTLIAQLSGTENTVKRDYADFLQVDVNNSNPQYISINTNSPVWNREQYYKVFTSARTSFTELI